MWLCIHVARVACLAFNYIGYVVVVVVVVVLCECS